MSAITVTVNCCLCSARHETKIELPAEWAHRLGAIDDETSGFCPEHAPIAEFAENQCPGCVGGWGDCGLWSAFAYKGRRDLSDADFTDLENGVCPKRTNGTMTVFAGRGKIRQLRLDKHAAPAAGKALAQAIRDYWERYSG